jgi:hypothetical protein
MDSLTDLRNGRRRSDSGTADMQPGFFLFAAGP